MNVITKCGVGTIFLAKLIKGKEKGDVYFLSLEGANAFRKAQAYMEYIIIH